MAKRPSLGRGLAALIPEAASPHAVATSEREGIREIPLDLIAPNPYQPRLIFDVEALQELANSIAVHGVIQPILVVPAEHGYQLVAGERRVQASRMAGLQTIPAQIREYDDRTILALALVENVQRAELDPIEKAKALRRLKVEFGATQEELAHEVGMSRSQLANLIRLLDLPDSVQAQIQAGQLTMGHAKVLLSLSGSDVPRYAGTCVGHGWSVRELEFAITRGWIDGPPPEPLNAVVNARQRAGVSHNPKLDSIRPSDPDIATLEKQLAERYGTPCKLRMTTKSTGSITFQFYSLEDSDRLLRKLLRGGEGG